MNQLILAQLTKIAQNKHTSIAAALYVLAKAGALLGAIWYPAHKDQFTQTAAVLESIAVTYGLVMAGDAKPTTLTP